MGADDDSSGTGSVIDYDIRLIIASISEIEPLTR